DANTGTGSFANAKKTFAGASGIESVWAAGDLILVEYRHDEPLTASRSVAAPSGSAENPVIIVSVDKDNSNAPRAGAKYYIGSGTNAALSFATSSGSQGLEYWLFDQIGCTSTANSTSNDLMFAGTNN